MQQTASRNDVAASVYRAMSDHSIHSELPDTKPDSGASKTFAVTAGLLAIAALAVMLMLNPAAAVQTPVMIMIFAVGAIALRLQRRSLKHHAEQCKDPADQRLASERIEEAELRARVDQSAI